jgi:hypothetical protein
MLELIGTCALVFVLAVGLATLLSAVTRRFKPARLLQPGDTIRVKTVSCVYRCRVESVRGSQVHISAPLSRNHYVPLRIGEQVGVEITNKDGVVAFRSEILQRLHDGRELVLAAPHDVFRYDRRQYRRYSYGGGRQIRVDDIPTELIDLSNGGCKFRTWGDFKTGERVHISLPWMPGHVPGWILEGKLWRAGTPTVNEYRAVFEEPIESPEAWPEEQAA